MRIFVCVGTRPECIKMAPLILELKARAGANLSVTVCHSGQHGEMADEVMSFFGIEPDIRLSVMREGQSLHELTAKLLEKIDVVFEAQSPDIVLVHGDTTTAFCAALAAFYRGIKVAHIEAGLRTHNVHSPFPEEFNRVAVDAMSELCFAPTASNAENLAKEGKGAVFTVGNTVIDAFKYTLDEGYSSPLAALAEGRRLVLVTTHRRENRGEVMRGHLLAVGELARSREDIFFVLPCHPSREVREAVEEVLGDIKKIKICPPLPLYDFHNLLYRAAAVISDSGGVQEEAAYLGVPLFLLRDTTERGEAVGVNTVALGTSYERVRETLHHYFDEPSRLESLRVPTTAFGTGNASRLIADILLGG